MKSFREYLKESNEYYYQTPKLGRPSFNNIKIGDKVKIKPHNANLSGIIGIVNQLKKFKGEKPDILIIPIDDEMKKKYSHGIFIPVDEVDKI